MQSLGCRWIAQAPANSSTQNMRIEVKKQTKNMETGLYGCFRLSALLAV